MKSTSTETYRFPVGHFRCIAVNDGYLSTGSITDFYPYAPLEELRLAQQPFLVSPNTYAYPCIGMFVDTGTRRVLVDPGGGKDVPELGRLADGLPVVPQLGALMTGLEREHIEPDSIDLVIISHAHIDHVGGSADSNGNPMFPNARYVFARGEWNEVTSKQIPDADHEWDGWVPANRYEQERCMAVRHRVELVDPEVEIVPGVRIIPTPGETPHHIAVEFFSGSERLICVGDALTTPIDVDHPEWIPESHLASNREILRRAGSTALVHGFHFPFPGLGRISADGDGWRWHELQTQSEAG